jgi:hypothetical protein
MLPAPLWAAGFCRQRYQHQRILRAELDLVK